MVKNFIASFPQNFHGHSSIFWLPSFSCAGHHHYMEFEWDDVKNTTNQKKHGLKFQLAKDLFAGDDTLHFSARVVTGSFLCKKKRSTFFKVLPIGGGPWQKAKASVLSSYRLSQKGG